MIKIKKSIKILTLILSILSVLIFSLIIYGYSTLPDFTGTINNEISFSGIYTASLSEGTNSIGTEKASASTTANSDIKLFGTIPVKSISITKSDRKYLIPGGELVGIRLKTSGVLVVGTESFLSNGKEVSPAEKAGIRVGDALIRIDGKTVSTNKELSEIIASSEGKSLKLTVKRGEIDTDILLKPEISDITGTYKGGLWIRDATGGIGTLTYIDIENGTFASLGHGIYDTDTNQLLPAESGELYSANLTGIKKGLPGNAGEIKGVIGGTRYASISSNCEKGVYGNIYYIDDATDMIPVATADEIKQGSAQIISTVIDDTKDYYDIEIERINHNTENKNMIIKVTDKRLLQATGGIIQGMSGSPIIQNGMIVGAVTHVFLNDPSKGYAILIENMMDAA